MRHLFDSWSAVSRRLHTAPNVLLFLDFDGTLANIVARPSLARLAPGTRRTLSRLARRRSVRICVISSRDRATLRKLVSIPRVRCLGLYGWENGRSSRTDAPTLGVLRTARDEIASRLRMSGARVWLEDKRLAFAVHYRGATPVEVRQARRILCSVLAHVETLRLQGAKKAWDVVPASLRGKGEAVQRELAALPKGLGIYAGDDEADESAFDAIRPGISIHVGIRRRSHAQYRLRNPDEVREFLERLENELS